jgi:hypothetical protein
VHGGTVVRSGRAWVGSGASAYKQTSTLSPRIARNHTDNSNDTNNEGEKRGPRGGSALRRTVEKGTQAVIRRFFRVTPRIPWHDVLPSPYYDAEATLVCFRRSGFAVTIKRSGAGPR